MMVETHSKRLSSFGPAEQLDGGSRLMSASSFWILGGQNSPWGEREEGEGRGGGYSSLANSCAMKSAASADQAPRARSPTTIERSRALFEAQERNFDGYSGA